VCICIFGVINNPALGEHELYSTFPGFKFNYKEPISLKSIVLINFQISFS